MTEIWKYPLRIMAHQIVNMPRDPRVLSVQFQRDVLCLWAIVTPTEPLFAHDVWIVGTGQEIHDHFTKDHIATVQDEVQGAGFVWHVFMLHKL